MIDDIREENSYDTLFKEESVRPSWLERLDTKDVPDGRSLLID